MAVKLRLTRTGRHESPFYRIVAADSRYSRDGRYCEQIGYYDPAKGISSAVINEEAALNWLVAGAQYSDTLKAILTSKGLIVKAKELRAKGAVKKANIVSSKAKEGK